MNNAKCIYCGNTVSDPYDSFCSDECCNAYGNELEMFDTDFTPMDLQRMAIDFGPEQ